jgi:prepilin-type N-terminal cleavage/methylation domain-containing protein
MFVFHPRARAGFTLIELLVVIAIIVLLMALILPAIQKVREAANKMMCGNHLRQICLAMHNYHNDYNCLPTAGSYDSGNPPTDRRDWGWAYEILPYIEQDSLYREPSNAVIRRTVIKIYYCPSRRNAKLYKGEAKTDYAGNGATRITSDALDGAIIKHRGSLNSFRSLPGRLSNGFLPDGTSNTIFLAEKLINWPTMGGDPNDFTDNESWAGPGFSDGDIMRGCRIISGVVMTPIRDTNDIIPPDTELFYRFGSSHVTGVNAVFGDGSVRMVRFGVDPETFRRACVRFDGEALDLNDL